MVVGELGVRDLGEVGGGGAGGNLFVGGVGDFFGGNRVLGYYGGGGAHVGRCLVGGIGMGVGLGVRLGGG